MNNTKIEKCTIIQLKGLSDGSNSVLVSDKNAFANREMRILSIKTNWFATAQTTTLAESPTTGGAPNQFWVLPANNLLSKAAPLPFNYANIGKIKFFINGSQFLFSGNNIFSPDSINFDNLSFDYNEKVQEILFQITAEINREYSATLSYLNYTIDLLVELK